MKLEEHRFSNPSNDDDNQFTPSIFYIDPTIETSTRIITGTVTTTELTLEKFQQQEDEHYEANERAEEATNPTGD